MPVLVNHTSFATTMFGGIDPQSRQHDVLVVSAAFVCLPGQRLRLADTPVPVRDSDVYAGEPGASSVRYEGEVAWEKPYVDVIVNGRAVAPPGRTAERILVDVRVGDVRKQLMVTGDRRRRAGGLLSSPQPYETMPIVYERAYGGYDRRAEDPAQHRLEPRNPVGVGFQSVPSANPAIRTDVPNIEYPHEQMSTIETPVAPAGLGVIARGWQPRLGFAGTYDAAWQAEQFPLLPLDFDLRHFQAVPSDQQSRTLAGGEPVDIRNMTPEGRWQFTLPVLDVPIRLVYAERQDVAALRLDTVILEPDTHQITLVARCRIPWMRGRGPLQEVIVGHVSPVWLYARKRGLIYLDHGNRQGRVGVSADFHLVDSDA